MTITTPAAANVLTYEQYMAEEPVYGRYDIIEGVRVSRGRVWPETRTVAVLRLAPGGAVAAASYEETQSLTSISFPDLVVPVAEFFKP